MDQPPAGVEEPSLKAIVWQTVVFTLVIVGAVAMAALAFREPLEQLADWVITTFGLPGVFAGVLITDAFTFPVPPDTYLLIAVASGTDVIPILAVCCAGSIIAGNIAFAIGPYIGKVPILNRRVERFRPRGEALYAKWGVWTVAIAALTPIPFSVVCWFAGIYGMSWPKFFLTTWARIPRLVGYYFLFLAGW